VRPTSPALRRDLVTTITTAGYRRRRCAVATVAAAHSRDEGIAVAMPHPVIAPKVVIAQSEGKSASDHQLPGVTFRKLLRRPPCGKQFTAGMPERQSERNGDQALSEAASAQCDLCAASPRCAGKTEPVGRSGRPLTLTPLVGGGRGSRHPLDHRLRERPILLLTLAMIVNIYRGDRAAAARTNEVVRCRRLVRCFTPRQRGIARREGTAESPGADRPHHRVSRRADRIGSELAWRGSGHAGRRRRICEHVTGGAEGVNVEAFPKH